MKTLLSYCVFFMLLVQYSWAQQGSFYFNVNSPASVYNSYLSETEFSVTTEWGGIVTTDVVGDLIYAQGNDTLNMNMLCEPDGQDMTGKVALIRRGGCFFSAKALNAQQQGAIGVVLIDIDETLILMSGGDQLADSVTIPVIMLPLTIGEGLLNELNNGETVEVEFSLNPNPVSAFTGSVYQDEGGDCSLLDETTKLAGWKVIAQGNGFERLTYTNNVGDYFIKVPLGDYTLSIEAPNDLWSPCIDNTIYSVTEQMPTTVNLLANAIQNCAALNVELGAALLRRCFDNNTINVEYCNFGTIPAEDAFINLILDPLLILESSTIPNTQELDGSYNFDLGTVDVGACNSFQLTIEVSCDSDLGQVLCAEAEIFPDTCNTPLPLWSGADIRVNGDCAGDQVNFNIKNRGTGDMDSPQEYRIFKDGILVETSTFQLNSNETELISVEADGATYRVEADQVANHPYETLPSKSVEACAPLNTLFSTGFFLQFPLSEYGEPFDQLCLEVIGAYDPNDKQGFPRGYGPEHFIEENTDLEYLVRFQNTGTDTAFNVFVLDTLSEHLDINTLRPGPSSHDYVLNILANNVLEFRFDNIMLPDSNVNEAASNGYFTFKIAQQIDLPIGTVINNSAAIYFDFNEPIITNTTFHEIGEDFLPVGVKDIPKEPLIGVQIAPNPARELASIQLDVSNFDRGTIDLYDVNGQLVQVQQFSQTNFEVNLKNRAAGMYFYLIRLDGQPVASGKLLVE